jgi:DNA repair protein RadD
MPRRPGQDVEVIDGDLAHVKANGRVHPNQYSPEERHQFHRMLTGIAMERNYKPGWAAHKFKERFGTWPSARSVPPLEPNAEVLAWDRHCRIRYAKRMQKEAGNA